MQKDEIRERLVELISEAQDCGCDVTDVVDMIYVENEVLADHLLAHGVTVREWIPVAEQLPTEEDEDVSGCVLAIERQDGFARRWAGRSVRNCPELFTYWMPLPQVPKEDDNGRAIK